MAKLASKTVSTEEVKVVLTFSNGTVLSLGVNEVNDAMRERLALHGLSQKMGDALAGEDDVNVAIAKVEAITDRLRNGEWAGSGGGSAGGDLALALSNLLGKELPEVLQQLATKTDDQLKEIKKSPHVKLELSKIKQARLEAKAAESGDLETLLAS